jgi:hypothetical protein
MENGKQMALPGQLVNGDLHTGLTKREYFTVMAMQGMLANPNTGFQNEGGRFIDPSLVAQGSIKFADELLKQLNKSE